jgi:hypothetical protein
MYTYTYTMTTMMMIDYILSNIMDSIIECLYIGLLAFSYYHLYIAPKMRQLEERQEISYKALVKVKNIANIDTELRNEESQEIDKIKMDINRICNYICLNLADSSSSQNQDYDEECQDDVSSQTDSTQTPTNKPVLPIQNHIKFPHFWLFDENNFIKQSSTTKNISTYKMIGNDVRLLSNQLALFLKRDIGTCLEFEEVYNEVIQYINDNQITALNEDSKLRKLFNISEDEDYEYSYSELVKVIGTLLEPHLKIPYDSNK